MPPASDPPSSASLRRDLEILDVLASEECLRRGGLGVVRIAERLGRENSQVSRALRALAAAGMVERDAQNLDYRLGWRLYSYATRTFEARLVHLAGPYVRRLVAAVQEATHLCVLRSNQVLTLWSEYSPQTYRAQSWEGISVPVMATSAGRVLLCDWEPEVVRRWFTDDDLVSAGERPRIRTVDDLVKELVVVRQRGYALVREEFEIGVVACAAPVKDVRGRVIAAVSISAPRPRLGDRLDQAGRLAARCASDISRALRQENARK